MFKKYIKNPFQRQIDDSLDNGLSSVQGFGFMPQDQQLPIMNHETNKHEADVHHLLQVQKFVPPAIKTTNTAIQDKSNNEDKIMPPEDQKEMLEEDCIQNLFFDPPEMIVGKQVSLKGELSFCNLVQIDGSFEGQINAQGGLIISATGHVISPRIELKQAVIAGSLVGDIAVEDSLILKSTACVTGNICARRLTVESGARIQGNVTVIVQSTLAEEANIEAN